MKYLCIGGVLDGEWRECMDAYLVATGVWHHRLVRQVYNFYVITTKNEGALIQHTDYVLVWRGCKNPLKRLIKNYLSI